MRVSRTTLSASALTLTAAAGMLIAGPFAPPAGPVGSSYKTLTDIEPRTAINATNTPGNATSVYRIMQPGSYYLTGNITNPVGKVGIRIETTGVSVDLNGFSISNGLSGVTANPYNSEIIIFNGSIYGPSGIGVDLRNCGNCRVDNVRVDSNNQTGGDSISTGDHAQVSGCQIYGNSAGIGIKVGGNASIRNCTVTSSGSHGYQVDYGSRVSDCTAAYCSGDGFSLLGANAIVSGCVASQCALNGFELVDSNIVESCSSYWNSRVGVLAASRSTVRNCTVYSNSLQGISFQSRCTVVNNQVRDNGPAGYAGIWAQGAQNHIEGNDTSDNGFGVYVSGASNTIVRNSFTTNNTNLYIVAGNHVGPIVTPTTNAAAINGSSGGGLGTTDPNANFVY